MLVYKRLDDIPRKQKDLLSVFVVFSLSKYLQNLYHNRTLYTIIENVGVVTHLVIGEKRKMPMRKETGEHVIHIQEIETVGEDVFIVSLKKHHT